MNSSRKIITIINICQAAFFVAASIAWQTPVSTAFYIPAWPFLVGMAMMHPPLSWGFIAMPVVSVLFIVLEIYAWLRNKPVLAAILLVDVLAGICITGFLLYSFSHLHLG